jgi:hypothetical protein
MGRGTNLATPWAAVSRMNQSQAIPVAAAFSPSHTLWKRSTTISGRPGLIMGGSVPIQFVVADYIAGVPQADNRAIVAINLATGVADKMQPLNPLGFGTNDTLLFPGFGPEILEAAQYRRFRFTKLTIHYTGRVDTATRGALWVGYYPDGVMTSADVQFGVFHQLPGSMNVQVWVSDIAVDFSPYLNTADFFYTDFQDGGNETALRQSIQGNLIAMWDNPPSPPSAAFTGRQYYGYLWADYTIEMIEPTGEFNIAGSSKLTSALNLARLGPLGKHIAPMLIKAQQDKGDVTSKVCLDTKEPIGDEDASSLSSSAKNELVEVRLENQRLKKLVKLLESFDSPVVIEPPDTVGLGKDRKESSK